MSTTPTNPILDELSKLSPGAQSALLQAHQSVSQAPTATIPPPTGGVKVPAIGRPAYEQPTTALQKPSNAPSMPASDTSAPIPKMNFQMPNLPQTMTPPTLPKPAKGTMAGDLAERQRLMDTGPGISQIHSKIENSEFGQNHPTLGKILGWGAQIPLQALDVAGSTLAPRLAMMTPGTELHHLALLKQDNNAIKQDEETEKEKAATGLQNAETYRKLHPAEKYTTIDSDEGKMRFDTATGEVAPLTVNGQSLQSPGKKTAPVLHETDQGLMLVNPETKEVTPLTYGGQPLMPKSAAPKGREHVNLQGQSGPIAATYDPGSGKYFDSKGQEISNPVPYEKPEKTGSGEGRSDKSYQFHASELDKLGTPIQQRLGRLGTLVDTVYQKTPQADALIAPELLTVMAGGQGSGLRMNEAEIARIVGGRSKWEDLKSAVNKWKLDPSKALSITDEQRDEINNLLKTVSNKLYQKNDVLTDARRKLSETDDPHTHRKILADTYERLANIDEGKQNPTGGQGGGKEIHYKIVGGKLVAQ